MISPLLRPFVAPKSKRLLKATQRMTIAIGMLCEGGLIIAADTQFTWQDGRTGYGQKVHEFLTDTGTYVIAYSADDANAAETFVSEVKRALSKPLKSLPSVENSVKEMLRKWNASFSHPEDRIAISFLLGAYIKQSPSNTGDRLGLYLCETPFTVARKTHEHGGGYIASGCGQAATDPLFRILFSASVSPRTRLNQIAYLMHRAKMDFRGGCGGDTDAVFLRLEDGIPLWIERPYMAQAESFARHLDDALAKTASLMIPEKIPEYPQPILDFVADVEMKSLTWRRFVFRAKNGETLA